MEFPYANGRMEIGPRYGRWVLCCDETGRTKTPTSILKLVEVIGDLIPDGVINIVNGFGAEVGQALATSDRIAKLASKFLIIRNRSVI